MLSAAPGINRAVHALTARADLQNLRETLLHRQVLDSGQVGERDARKTFFGGGVHP